MAKRTSVHGYWVAPGRWYFVEIAPDLTGETVVCHYSGSFNGRGGRVRLEPLLQKLTARRTLDAIDASKRRHGYLRWSIHMGAPRIVSYHVVLPDPLALGPDGLPRVLFIRRVNVNDAAQLQRYGVHLFNRYFERVDMPDAPLSDGLVFADGIGALLESEPAALAPRDKDLIREALIMGDLTVTQGRSAPRYATAPVCLAPRPARKSNR